MKENLLRILQQNYFDHVILEDYSIIYNYKNFHNQYGALLNASIDKLDATLKEIQTAFNDLWEDYKKSHRR